MTAYIFSHHLELFILEETTFYLRTKKKKTNFGPAVHRNTNGSKDDLLMNNPETEARKLELIRQNPQPNINPTFNNHHLGYCQRIF